MSKSVIFLNKSGSVIVTTLYDNMYHTLQSLQNSVVDNLNVLHDPQCSSKKKCCICIYKLVVPTWLYGPPNDNDQVSRTDHWMWNVLMQPKKKFKASTYR